MGLSIFAAAAHAQPAAIGAVNKSTGNLMIVLREAAGQNRADDSLAPVGAMKAKLSDGREVEVQPAWYQFIGDMHLRFVFDGPTAMRTAMADDLKALDLPLAAAVTGALENIKRVYGDPQSKPLSGGIMEVVGKSPDLNSSYFVDKGFWNALLQQHPAGLVAAVPKRGSLLYAPASDTETVAALRRQIASLHSSSEQLRVSSALYLFKDGKWTVFQAPVGK